MLTNSRDVGLLFEHKSRYAYHVLSFERHIVLPILAFKSQIKMMIFLFGLSCMIVDRML